MPESTKKISPASKKYWLWYANLMYSQKLSQIVSKEIFFIVKKLKLKSEMKILDLGCAGGGHSLEFSKRGYFVTGIDSSKKMITLAKREAQKRNLSVNFFHGDMRRLSFENKFDAVISIFSFGFLETKQEHKIALEQITHALKEGGKLLLVTGNSPAELRIAKKHGTKNKKTGIITYVLNKELSNGDKVNQTEIIDTVAMHEIIKMEMATEDGTTYTNEVAFHLFTPAEIKKLLNDSGLKIIKTWGDFDGSLFSKNSKRLIILAEKK